MGDEHIGEGADRNGADLSLDSAAAEVYEQLKSLAANYLAAEAATGTLQPTLIVHEAYVRLARQPNFRYRDPGHFRALACMMMRRVLVDHARARNAKKRGSEEVLLGMEPDLVIRPGHDHLQVLAIDEAITRLAAHSQRSARIVEIRFFGGLTIKEAADELGISLRQAVADWTHAKAWLARELQDHE